MWVFSHPLWPPFLHVCVQWSWPKGPEPFAFLASVVCLMARTCSQSLHLPTGGKLGFCLGHFINRQIFGWWTWPKLGKRAEIWRLEMSGTDLLNWWANNVKYCLACDWQMYSQKLQLSTLNNYELYTHVMMTMDPISNKSNNSRKLPNLSSAKRS